MTNEDKYYQIKGEVYRLLAEVAQIKHAGIKLDANDNDLSLSLSIRLPNEELKSCCRPPKDN